MRARTSLLFLVATVAALAAQAAYASPQFAATFRMAYLSSKPDTATGLKTVMTWSDSGEPGGVPKAIQRINLRFYSGTRFDTSALRTCGASDADVMATGASACPSKSELGSGSTIGVFTGGAQFKTHVVLFNARRQIIVLVTLNGVPTTVFRDEVRKGRIIVKPKLPAGVSLERLALRINPHSSGAGAAQRTYMRTPPSCPASHRWGIVGRFTYADGSRQTLSSGSACRPAVP